MSRDVPFDEDATCQDCGKKGAYDFMGDLICGNCLQPAELQKVAKGCKTGGGRMTEQECWNDWKTGVNKPQAEQGQITTNCNCGKVEMIGVDVECEYCNGRGEVTGFPKNMPCPNGCRPQQEPIPDTAMAIIRDLVEQYRNDEAHDQSTPIWPIVDRAEKLLKRWQGRKE